MNLQISKEWLLRMAEKEGNGIVSVGGLIGQVKTTSQVPSAPAAERSALAQLVEWQRRKLRLTVAALANKADIELEDMLAAEKGEEIPEPRTVFKLAQALGLPIDKLMHLGGLVVKRDSKLEQAAVRFAACSAPISVLTPEEAKALEEFVRVLGE